MKLKNEKGFTALEVILIIVLLAVVGFVGYRVHQARQTTSTTTVSTTPSANVFSVPELGFKMTLPAGLNDLEYAVNSSTFQITDANNKPTGVTFLKAVYFTTKSLVQAAPDCQVSSQPSGVLIFGKYNADPTSVKLASGPTAVEKVGSFYLTIEDKQTDCSQTSAANKQEGTLVQQLTQAFKTAEPL